MDEYVITLYGYNEDGDKHQANEWRFTDFDEAIEKFECLEANLKNGDKPDYMVTLSGWEN